MRRWANPLEDLSFTAQEVGCLGKEVSRGVAVEAGHMGLEILKEGVDLTIDTLASLVTLGAADPPSPLTRRGRSPRRRGR